MSLGAGGAGAGPLRAPFMIVPNLPAGEEEEEKERVDAEAASSEVRVCVCVCLCCRRKFASRKANPSKINK